MSQENVEIVRSIFAAWECGDYSSAGWAHPETWDRDWDDRNRLKEALSTANTTGDGRTRTTVKRPARARYLRLGMLLGLLLLLPATGTAVAATFKVTNTHSSGGGSLRHAIKQANSGGDHSDTIVINATGTIRLGSRLPNLRTHLAIKGPGAGKLTVRRASGTSSTFSIFTVSSHVTVRLSDISITSGLGSGIDTKGRLALSHGVVSDNKGAGVEIDDFGTLTASQVKVKDNGGGGLEGDKRFITVRHSTLSGNAGRAISSDRGDITVSRSKLSRNAGGGIFSDGGDIVVSRSTLRDNCVVGGDLCDSGGAIFNRNDPFYLGTLTVRRSTLIGNAATDSGGAIWTAGDAATVSQSTLGGNTAHDGGGIYGYGLTVSQSTLSGNIAQNGGGIESSGTASLESTIVADSPSGGDCAGAVTSNGHNLADDNSCGLAGQGDLPGTEPLLRRLDDYGGPTKTFALRPSSPAVDAGFAGELATDQRGRLRIVNYPGVPMAVGGDNSDIGAFELQRP